ncbi:unnamed protein product [Strongylus vulgaris]|uniref:Uncharacterized protein n=1 Tax=Strongylus vulgaris TaxID=40348 RepID=A0A3P7J2B4_STRVU|nr:unnamed protein product [Strongylus vulgaris]
MSTIRLPPTSTLGDILSDEEEIAIWQDVSYERSGHLESSNYPMAFDSKDTADGIGIHIDYGANSEHRTSIGDGVLRLVRDACNHAVGVDLLVMIAYLGIQGLHGGGTGRMLTRNEASTEVVPPPENNLRPQQR